jgi:Succinyl-CoA ligase like flavodoxin domain
MKFPSQARSGSFRGVARSRLILSEDERDPGFAYFITAGNEDVLNVADYLAKLAVDDRVKIILLFLETVRDPQKFQAPALKAVEQGNRIIALKLGSSSGGRALVQAHTGSLFSAASTAIKQSPPTLADQVLLELQPDETWQPVVESKMPADDAIVWLLARVDQGVPARLH